MRSFARRVFSRSGEDGLLEAFDGLPHRCGDLGVLRGDVAGFLEVLREIEELNVVALDDHLPVLAAHCGPEFGLVAEEDVAVGKGFLIEEVILGAGTIEIVRIAVGDAGEFGEGWEEIEADEKGIGPRAGLDFSWPPRHGRNPVPALILAELATTQSPLHRAHRDVAIVRPKEDEGVVGQSQFADGIDDLANAGVQILHHLHVTGAVFVVGAVLIPPFLAILRRVSAGLVGIVRSLVGDVEEEWLILLTLDEVDAFLGDDVRRVALHVLSLETIAPAPVPVVIPRPIEETDELVEAVMGGVKFVLVAAVPLAEESGCVALFFEDLAEGGRGCGNPLIGFPVANDDVDDAGALLVATGEKSGAGRAAHRGVGMEVGKGHSFPCHALDPGRLDPAIVELQVAATEVVREDDDDVWGPGGRAEDGYEEGKEYKAKGLHGIEPQR